MNEYHTMHYFGNPRDAQSMIAYMILTKYFWKSNEKLHCGNVDTMPYLILEYMYIELIHLRVSNHLLYMHFWIHINEFTTRNTFKHKLQH